MMIVVSAGMTRSTATVIWTHMIDFDFSADAHPIYGQTSAEVKLYTQHCCCDQKEEEDVFEMTISLSAKPGAKRF